MYSMTFYIMYFRKQKFVLVKSILGVFRWGMPIFLSAFVSEYVQISAICTQRDTATDSYTRMSARNSNFVGHNLSDTKYKIIRDAARIRSRMMMCIPSVSIRMWRVICGLGPNNEPQLHDKYVSCRPLAVATVTYRTPPPRGKLDITCIADRGWSPGQLPARIWNVPIRLESC